MGERPTVDFTRLLQRTHQIVYKIHEKKQLISHLEQANVSVYANHGSVQFTDAHTLTAGDGTRLQAEMFILCAGGRPRRLSFPGNEHALTHSDVWALPRLPKSVIVVGGAATGWPGNADGLNLTAAGVQSERGYVVVDDYLRRW